MELPPALGAATTTGHVVSLDVTIARMLILQTELRAAFANHAAYSPYLGLLAMVRTRVLHVTGQEQKGRTKACPLVAAAGAGFSLVTRDMAKEDHASALGDPRTMQSTLHRRHASEP